jgi:hypothetical protein
MTADRGITSLSIVGRFAASLALATLCVSPVWAQSTGSATRRVSRDLEVQEMTMTLATGGSANERNLRRELDLRDLA